MPDYTILAGATSQSIEIFIFNPTTGLPDSTVLYSDAGLVLQYRRKGAANVNITEVNLAALTTAWTDSGFLLIGNGAYRLDLPNAAVAAGSTGVLVHGTMTSRVVINRYIDLVAYNSQDAIRLGLTSLPNVVSGLAGAIPTTGTGANQIAVTSGAILLSSGTETKLDDILVDTAALDSRLTAGRATNLENLDVAISDVAGSVLDESFAGHDISGTPGAVLGALPEATAGTTGGLALYDNINSIALIGSVDDATVTATASAFAGNSGLEGTSNTKYVGAFLVFPEGTPLHPEARKISSYTAATRTFAFSGTGDDADRPFSAAPGNGDPFFIVGIHGT